MGLLDPARHAPWSSLSVVTEARGDRSKHLGVLLMLMRVLNDLGGWGCH